MTSRPKGPTTVIFLDRNKLQLVGGGVVGVVSLDLLDNLVRDMEVIDPGVFTNYLYSFIQKTKVVPSNVIIVLSEALCFSMDVQSQTTDEEKRKLMQDFSNTVPFEVVQAKLFELSENWRVIAVNKKLYETVKQAFEAKGFMVTKVLPAFTLPTVGVKTTLTPETVKPILVEIEKIKTAGFLEQVKEESPPEGGEEPFFVKNKRFIILSGVLIILLAIFVVFLLLR